MGSIPGLGRSPGGGHSNPLQYPCLENPMDRGAWQATVHRVAKSRTRLKRLGTCVCVCVCVCVCIGLPRCLNGKESACQCRRHKFDPWIGKIPWRKKWQPISVFLPGKFYGQRNLAVYSSWGHKGLGMTECAHSPVIEAGCLPVFLPLYS